MPLNIVGAAFMREMETFLAIVYAPPVCTCITEIIVEQTTKFINEMVRRAAFPISDRKKSPPRVDTLIS